MRAPSPPAPLDPFPTPPGPSRRGLSAGRDLGSAASAQRPPCPGGDQRPRPGRAVTLLRVPGARGHPPPPPDLGPLQGPAPHFQAPRPAPRRLFGGARRGICRASLGARFPASSGGAAAPPPPSRRLPPHLPRARGPKPIPQAASPPVPAKDATPGSCPSPFQASPRMTTGFPRKTPWNSENLYGMSSLKMSSTEDGLGAGRGGGYWLSLFGSGVLGQVVGIREGARGWKPIRCYLVQCWDLLSVQSSRGGTLSSLRFWLELWGGSQAVLPAPSRCSWSPCGAGSSAFRVWVRCSSLGQVVGAFSGVAVGGPPSICAPASGIFCGCQRHGFGTCPGRLGPGVSSSSRFVWK